MKLIAELLEMTAEGRSSLLKSTVTTVRNGKTLIAKILVAATEKGDFKEGEMNAYAQRVTGVELRREIQGVYEAVNVLAAIRGGKLEMSELEFECCPDFGRVCLSSFLAKAPEKVAAALEIIRSGVDVTKRLKALRKASAEDDSPEGEGPTGDDDGPGGGKPKPEGEGSDDSEDSETPASDDVDRFEIPKTECALSHRPLIDRILADFTEVDAEGLATLDTVLDKLKAKVAEAFDALPETSAKAA